MQDEPLAGIAEEMTIKASRFGPAESDMPPIVCAVRAQQLVLELVLERRRGRHAHIQGTSPRDGGRCCHLVPEHRLDGRDWPHSAHRRAARTHRNAMHSDTTGGVRAPNPMFERDEAKEMALRLLLGGYRYVAQSGFL